MKERWSKSEIKKLMDMRAKKYPYDYIAKKLGRSVNSCMKKYHTMMKKTNDKIGDFDINRDSICWLCARSLRDCKKPVEGWTATKSLYRDHNGDEKGFSYKVKYCPRFKKEPWLDCEVNL